MKTIFTFMLSILMSITSYSQDLNGIYLSSTSDTLIIYNDSFVRFNFNYGCCLLLNYYGFGKLTKSGDYRIVKTEDADDCILQEGNELYDSDLKLNMTNNDTIILDGIIAKDYKAGTKLIWYLTHLPWKWKYKHYHDPRPIIFVKNNPPKTATKNEP